MVRIRLRKVGSKRQQSFRIVAADREHPRDGRFLEMLGVYNPRTDPATIKLEEARVYHWLKNGAQPSESVMKLFKVSGTLERFNRLKAGEALETLLAEAAVTREVDPRTKRPAASTPAKPSKKKKAAAEGEKTE